MSLLRALPTPTQQEGFTEFIFSDQLRSILQERGDASEATERPEHQPSKPAHAAAHEMRGWVEYEPQPLMPKSSSQDTTDAFLVEQAATGNERAFELLVQHYETPIRQFVSHHQVCAEDAQDVMQFVFLQLYLYLPRLQGRLVSPHCQRPLKAWLLKVARNRCYDERRKKHLCLFSELETTTGEGTSPFECLADTAPLPEATVEQQDRHRQILAAIQTLPSRFRSIVSLRYREELTFREIGHRLNIPENTAKTCFQRARPLLRAVLASL
jgi:RNA polymerase sigma factor (sigma-70 family)